MVSCLPPQPPGLQSSLFSALDPDPGWCGTGASKLPSTPSTEVGFWVPAEATHRTEACQSAVSVLLQACLGPGQAWAAATPVHSSKFLATFHLFRPLTSFSKTGSPARARDHRVSLVHHTG